MTDEELTYAPLLPDTPPTMPTAFVWATSTSLAGTDKERKQYFIQLDDEDKRIQFILSVHADKMIQVEPYVSHEADYWEYDGDDEDDYDPYDDEDDYEEEEEEDAQAGGES